MGLLSAVIPAPYKYAAIALLLIAYGGFCYVKGASGVHKEWEADRLNQKLLVIKKQVQQAEVTTKVITQYVDRVQTVKEKGAEIIKEVPVYVTQYDNSRCIINNGFIRLHDAAVNSLYPGAATDIDETASTITLSRVIEVVTENYGICHETEEQLIGLQTWVINQYKLMQK